jgi:hypothetical protein
LRSSCGRILNLPKAGFLLLTVEDCVPGRTLFFCGCSPNEPVDKAWHMGIIIWRLRWGSLFLRPIMPPFAVRPPVFYSVVRAAGVAALVARAALLFAGAKVCIPQVRRLRFLLLRAGLGRIAGVRG